MQDEYFGSSQESEKWVSSQDSQGFPSLVLNAQDIAALDLLEAEFAASRTPHVEVEVESDVPDMDNVDRPTEDRRITATNLAIYHHLHCDLYLHLSYSSRQPSQKAQKVVSEIALAQFQKGDIWERTLFDSLDAQGILIRVEVDTPLSGLQLAQLLVEVPQTETYISGLTYLPPTFESEFASRGVRPVIFSVAKPDLVKVTRASIEGVETIIWEVIDAKSSKHVKTSHHVQIGWYAKCLSALLPEQYAGVHIVAASVASVWMPPLDSRPQSVPLSLLLGALDDLVFRRLPAIVHADRRDVSWHFNPLCSSCPWMKMCRANTVRQGRLGNIPNISPDEASLILGLLPADRSGTDIEELDKLFRQPGVVSALERERPTTIKKVKKRLALDSGRTSSSVLEAARTKVPQVTKRRTFSFPRTEDIAICISVVLDAGSGIQAHRVSVFSDRDEYTHSPSTDIQMDFLTELSGVIGWISGLEEQPGVQFYTFSRVEQRAIQQHLIDLALSASSSSDEQLLKDVRASISALCDGASVVSTMFQPTLLSDALSDWLGKPSTFKKKADLQECLRRFQLATIGTVKQLRERLEEHLASLRAEPASQNRTLGGLPRIVVIQEELERLVAVPAPGFYGLPEAAALLYGDKGLPSDENLLGLVAADEFALLGASLSQRNAGCYSLIKAIRRLVAGSTQYEGTILMNDARPLANDAFMELCDHPTLRKLVFVQQFEVLTRLQELWLHRRDNCPDAVMLRYSCSRQADGNQAYVFDLEDGSVDTVAEREFGFYEWLLVEDSGPSDTRIPAENYFDDLAFCSILFQLGGKAADQWKNQHPSAKHLLVANIASIQAHDNGRQVALQVYPSWAAKFKEGAHYRLTPRLVDFNFTKILRALIALDWASQGGTLPPFSALIQDPVSFAHSESGTFGDAQDMQAEARIHSTLRQLRDLDVDGASALVFKDSQRRAVQRMINSRLCIVHGPPGTGKTYTVSLSLLRMVECRYAAHGPRARTFFVTAVTHAAIEAFRKKVDYLVQSYMKLADAEYELRWLKSMRFEHVKQGGSHVRLPVTHGSVHVYCGTAYQLDNFARRFDMGVDAVFIDEAGQMSLGIAALALRWLKPDECKIVLAGDHLQLGTILAAQYPDTTPPLFGSILDLITDDDRVGSARGPPSSFASNFSSQRGPIVQITENFRLNPDLSDFVSTIYRRKMTAMKSETKHTGEALRALRGLHDGDDIALLLADLGDAMTAKSRTHSRIARPERPFRSADEVADAQHRSTSLALLRLAARDGPDRSSYESHIRLEADVTARLIGYLRRAFPNSSVFVACPHRVQRTAVRQALAQRSNSPDLDNLTNALSRMNLQTATNGRGQRDITIDTVERLQGQEADLVICCFAHTHRATLQQDLGFLFQRRRLNVAISRAKMLAIVLSSDDVLTPPLNILADKDAAEGFAFLRAYEQRAWSGRIVV
ncbi:P-loop containing nucleoside triphosphate hydrolase protein [Auricularia subglabra TFB-10046 SS5]|nr:P-loop containing nucleoside triphosphate hydrolase protein [Auricularia subglabra TFB-10046 SS5]